MERCERCGQVHGLRFVCLGQHLCFACTNAVVRLTSRFPALHEIAASELAEVVSNLAAASAPDLCSRCSSTPAPFHTADRALCSPCARELAAAV